MLRTIILALGLGLMLIGCESPHHVKDAARSQAPKPALPEPSITGAVPAQANVAPQPVFKEQPATLVQPTSAPVTDLDRLIDQLSADDWAVRDSAQKALIEKARDQDLEFIESYVSRLQEKLAVQRDPETILRLEQVIKALSGEPDRTQVRTKNWSLRLIMPSDPNQEIVSLSGSMMLNELFFNIPLAFTNTGTAELNFKISRLEFYGPEKLWLDRPTHRWVLLRPGETRTISFRFSPDNFTKPGDPYEHEIPVRIQLTVEDGQGRTVRLRTPELIMLCSRHSIGHSRPKYSVEIDKLVNSGAKEAGPKLLELLNSPDYHTRSCAAKAAGDLGIKEAIPKLKEFLNDKKDTSYLAMSAADALVQLNAREIIPDLLLMLKSQDNRSRHRAVEMLGKMGAKEAGPELLLLINDSYCQRTVIWTLGALGVKAAIPQILELTRHNSQYLRRTAVDALSALAAQEAIPRLIELLKDADFSVRYSSIKALEQLRAKDAAPELTPFLKDNELSMRLAAGQVLVTLEAKETIPLLIELLKDPDPGVRMDSAETLGKFKAQEAIPQLVELLKDGQWEVVFRAARALGQMQAREAVPFFLSILKNNPTDYYLGPVVINALAELKAMEAVPYLKELLSHHNLSKDISQAAEKALKKLGVPVEEIEKAKK